MYQHIKVPAQGEKIIVNKDMSLTVPLQPIIPYIEGDGTGLDITPVMLKVVDAAVAKADLEVPEVMVNRRVEEILHEYSHQMPQGITLDQYFAMQGQTIDAVRESLRADAEMTIKRELVVEAVADAEKITPLYSWLKVGTRKPVLYEPRNSSCGIGW